MALRTMDYAEGVFKKNGQMQTYTNISAKYKRHSKKIAGSTLQRFITIKLM